MTVDEIVSFYDSNEMVWGETDCVCFIADLILAETGVDYFRAFRGTYSSSIGAAKIVRASSKSIEMIIAEMFPAKPVGFLSRGDLGFLPHHIVGGGLQAPFFVMGAYAVGRSESGVSRIDRALLKNGFEVS